MISNLPFQISSPITFKLLDYDFSQAVLIYQKEFADRMVAKQDSKHYSRLSVSIYYKAFCKILHAASKTCFSPPPKVDSCIVKLSPRKSPPFYVINEAFFFDITEKLFNHRRKKIKSTIKELDITRFEEVPYLDKRVEELTPEQIGKLSNVLFELQHK